MIELFSIIKKVLGLIIKNQLEFNDILFVKRDDGNIKTIINKLTALE